MMKRTTPFNTTMDRQRLKMLIVDDNHTNIIMMGEYAKFWDMEYDFAMTGNDAIRKVSHASYDFILMDLHMPDMDGFEATRKIIGISPDVKVIACTADAFEATKRKAYQAGFADYVIKPFNSRKLFETLMTHAGNTSSDQRKQTN
jgi:CheY-like chemotaxis protein